MRSGKIECITGILVLVFLIFLLNTMHAFFQYIQDMFANKTVRKKLLFTLAILALYRLFVSIPVPFVDIQSLHDSVMQSG